MATKKKPAKKVSEWPPMRWRDEPAEAPKPEKVTKRYLPKRDEQELVEALASLSGMSQELAEQIAKDSDRPDNAGGLAEKYKLSEMDAEAVLEVLNA